MGPPRDISESVDAFNMSEPTLPSTGASRNRQEVDHADALAVNDGVALFAGPGGVAVVFDFEGVREALCSPHHSWFIRFLRARRQG